MTQLVQFDLENGNGDSIYVEVDEKLTTSKPKPADDRISRRTDGVTQ